MTPKEFFENLEIVAAKKPFEIISGEIRQCGTGFCPVIAVGHEMSGLGYDLSHWDNSNYTEIGEDIGITEKFADMIANAADNKDEPLRAKLRKACKITKA